jgi:protein gp37
LAEDGRWTGEVRVNENLLEDPLRWRKSRKVFVAPMGDLFHPGVPDGVIEAVFGVMREACQHTFQVLTKRPKRMEEFIAVRGNDPLPNVWLGTSVESQDHIDRVHQLMRIDWPIKWVSLEPLLGEVRAEDLWEMDWIVIGGESGQLARPMHPRWVDSIISKWDGYIPIYFKQWGEWLPWGSGDYTRCWLELNGHQRPFEGAPRYSGDVMVTRVGKKKAGAKLGDLEWRQFPGWEE